MPPLAQQFERNGRVFLVPQAPGAQWDHRAVGNAEWTGVPLRTLLAANGMLQPGEHDLNNGAYVIKHLWRGPATCASPDFSV